MPTLDGPVYLGPIADMIHKIFSGVDYSQPTTTGEASNETPRRRPYAR